MKVQGGLSFEMAGVVRKIVRRETARVTMVRITRTAERVCTTPQGLKEGSPMGEQQVAQDVAGMVHCMEVAAWPEEIELGYGDNSLEEGKIVDGEMPGSSTQQWGHTESMWAAGQPNPTSTAILQVPLMVAAKSVDMQRKQRQLPLARQQALE
ncbi:hypothetical protein NDU88_009516 [Pleurodeles waltl]|uniref:Uncharacterized protein n=1 Tax=Pleurodeles waltl TaxID=8319 RepID=A0AAV7QT72_PLEWA|nr:hypothetical protein NDU88_009516 [Pleurodeles waltl]